MGTPARLPKNAPKALRDFVACRTTSVKLDANSLGWVPKPPGLPDSLGTKVTVKDGSTATSATLEVGFGDYISMDLPVSIGEHGELVVGGSDLPFGIGPRIDAWVSDFNDTLAENGKGLSGFDATGGALAVTKKTLVVAKEPVTPATPAPKIVTPTPKPPKKPVAGGCLTWVMVAAVAALAVTTAAVLALTGGDDGETNADRLASEAPEEQPTGSPADSSPMTPVVDSPSEPVPVESAPVDSTPQPDAGEAGPLDPLPECGAFGDGFESTSVTSWTDLDQVVSAAGECDATNGYEACTESALPCWDGTMPPFGVTSNAAGWNHSARVADAVTGDDSASVSIQSMWIQGTNPGVTYLTARVANDCGGRVVTGQAAIDADPTDGLVVDIVGPLFSYGPCGPPIFTIEAGPNSPRYRFPGAPEAAFVVDASEPDVQQPSTGGFVQTSDRLDTGGRYLDNVNTIHNVLGGVTQVDDGCMWFFPPDNVDQVVRVLDQCPGPLDRFWVFAAGVTELDIELQSFDTVGAHTGAFVNPLADPGATADQLAGFDASTSLFDNTIFPCGPGHVAYTACPSNPAPVAAGGYVAISGAMLDAIPLTGDGSNRSHTVDLSGQSYTATATMDGWRIESTNGSARARAIVRHDSMTFMIPRDELPDGEVSYQWSTTIETDTVTQPSVPVVGMITTPTIPRVEAAAPSPEPGDAPTAPGEPAPSESLEEFYEQLSTSVAAGDVGFSLDRLHPVVLDAYPSECPAALESFADPDLVIQFVADNGPEPWTWELSDGRSFDVPDAVSVTLRLSGRGQDDTESNAHVAIIDGEYRWFTLC